MLLSTLSDVIYVKTKDEFERLIAENDKVIVKFTAPSWCAPCRQLEPHFERASEKTDVKFLAVDVDDNAWAMVDFGIRSVPTVWLYQSGRYDKTIVGRTVVQILSELRE